VNFIAIIYLNQKMARRVKYKTYKGYNDGITPFTVFLVYGKEEFLLRNI